jgi:hypothetical protein
MPDPIHSDEDVIHLTRGYLSRRRGQPAPRDMEANAMNFAFARRGGKRAATLLGATALVLASAVTAVGVLAFHTAPRSGGGAAGPTAQGQLHIIRTPGNLVLPQLDLTISNSHTIASLAADIRALPSFPRGERCPAAFGTYYSLTFMPVGGSAWTARIQAQGCEIVEIKGKPTLWAAHSPQLWMDLRNALGLRANQVQPSVCLGPNTPSECVPLNQPGKP